MLIWKCDATEYSSKLMRMAFTYGKNAFSVFHSYESKELRRGNRSNAFFRAELRLRAFFDKSHLVSIINVIIKIKVRRYHLC